MTTNFVIPHDYASIAQSATANQFAGALLSTTAGKLHSTVFANSSMAKDVVVASAVIVMASSVFSATAGAGEKDVCAPIVQQSQSNLSARIGGVLHDSAELAAINYKYQVLSKAVVSLGRLDEDDPHYLDPLTVGSSKVLLELLHAFHVPPPKIFPHGGDALIFEWQSDEGLRYVTFEDGIARLRDFDAHSEYFSPVLLHLEHEEQMSILIKALGGKQWWIKQSNSSL